MDLEQICYLIQLDRKSMNISLPSNTSLRNGKTDGKSGAMASPIRSNILSSTRRVQYRTSKGFLY